MYEKGSLQLPVGFLLRVEVYKPRLLKLALNNNRFAFKMCIWRVV